MEATTSKDPVPLLALYRVFFYIGSFSFGGGLVSWIHREIVTVRQWMTTEEFLTGVALSQILPGVNSVNASIFVGQRLRGPLGALVCVAAMLTGPFIAIAIAAAVYQRTVGIVWFSDAIDGIAAVAIGMLTRLGLEGSRRVFSGIVPALAMAVTFVCVGILKWPMLEVVAFVAPISVALSWPRSAADA
jgi:chromate transporter